MKEEQVSVGPEMSHTQVHSGTHRHTHEHTGIHRYTDTHIYTKAQITHIYIKTDTRKYTNTHIDTLINTDTHAHRSPALTLQHLLQTRHRVPPALLQDRGRFCVPTPHQSAPL